MPESVSKRRAAAGSSAAGRAGFGAAVCGVFSDVVAALPFAMWSHPFDQVAHRAVRGRLTPEHALHSAIQLGLESPALEPPIQQLLANRVPETHPRLLASKRGRDLRAPGVGAMLEERLVKLFQTFPLDRHGSDDRRAPAPFLPEGEGGAKRRLHRVGARVIG